MDAHKKLSKIIGKTVNVEEYDDKFEEAKLLYDSKSEQRSFN